MSKENKFCTFTEKNKSVMISLIVSRFHWRCKAPPLPSSPTNSTKMSLFITRCRKVQRLLASKKLDALLITNSVNVRYLSGFTGGDSVLLIRRDSVTLLSDGRFTLQIEEECPDFNDFYIRPTDETMATAIAKAYGITKSGCLGVEAETLTLAENKRLQDKLPKTKIAPTHGIVETFRQIKDRSEISAIRKAIDVAAKAFECVRNGLRPDQTEISIRNEIEYQMRLHGAEEKSFSTIIAAGPRAALPHAVPSAQPIGGHPMLLFDWGAVVDGYMSDLTRVLVLMPTKKLRTVYETVLKAQLAAIDAIKPGKTGEEIDAVARGVIKDAGFAKHFNHGLGHSLGLEIHEDPRFKLGYNTVLKPGMVLTVEPGIYLKNWGGVRIEDDILVTKSGCEVLSRHVPKNFDF